MIILSIELGLIRKVNTLVLIIVILTISDIITLYILNHYPNYGVIISMRRIIIIYDILSWLIVWLMSSMNAVYRLYI